MSQEKYPLTYHQMNLWLHWLKSPKDITYSLPFVYKLEGRLDIKRLETILRGLVQKYRVLQLGFGENSGVPYQYLRDIPTQILTFFYNQSDNGDAECQKKLDNYINQPFDLTKDPLFQFVLIQYSPSYYYFFINIHHIVWDAVTHLYFTQDLTKLYNASSLSKEDFTPLNLPFVQWSETIKNLCDKDWQSAKSYWDSYLNKASPNIELCNLSNAINQTQLLKTGEFTLALTINLSKQCTMFTETRRASLFRILLAGFHSLLYRYSLQADITLSYVTDLRLDSSKKAMGYHMGLQPSRVHVADNTCFEDILRQVIDTVRNAKKIVPYNYMKFKFNSLEYQNIWGNIAFGKTYLYPNTLQLNDVKVSFISSSPISLVGDLTFIYDEVNYEESNGQILCKIAYNPKKFTDDFIKQLAQHFEVLLQGAIEQPQLPLYQLPLLTKQEHKTLLFDWNQTEAKYPKDKTIHQLFEEQVERTPDAIAVAFEDTQLMYRELNERSNQLAHYLRSRGVGRDTLVGISSERSLELIVGIVGILKAGGAYVPLDPSYPAERLAFMLSDTKAPVMLTNSAAFEQLTALMSRAEVSEISSQLVKLDKINLSAYSITNPSPISQPSDLAYMIYTSGSTGKPKGVMIEHGGVLNLLTHFQLIQPILPKQNATLWTSISFDVSVYEICSALLYGACLHVLPEKLRMDFYALFDYLQNEQIHASYLPPFMLKDFANWIISNNKKLSLTRLLVGVEPIPESLLVTIQKATPGLQIINAYGPSETSICSTSYNIFSLKENLGERSVPIGYPVANTKMYILDSNRELTPVGVSGELYIGGAGVARGYLNRPELTQERFIPNPFATKEDKAQGKNLRLYRTGDLVRYLPDGNIEFLGRIDHQVKIRGFRIELGEIESILSQQDELQHGVVIVKENDRGDKCLVAYVVIKPLALANVSENEKEGITRLIGFLRQSLKQRLPNYMVPEYIIPLVSLPLSPNGKVDRKALEKRDLPSTKLAMALDLKSTSKEELLLLDLWQKVLGHGSIELETNFFEAGGNSLLLIQLYSQLPGDWKSSIKMMHLFQYPTIQSLAHFIREQQQPVLPLKNLISSKDKLAHQPHIHDVAIIGMACRLPGADDIKQFWQLLQEGKETITHFSHDELAREGIDPALLKNPQYVSSRGMVSNIQSFDADFFRITPSDAQILDPQQRIFLECAWEALEAAGYDPSTYHGDIGIFAGVGINRYFQHHLANHAELTKRIGDFALAIANDKDSVATRISYKFNLTGPAVTVQTACSTSLVAVHMACQSLRTHESDMVLAGGVSLGDLGPTGYLYQQGMILSPDGHCRAFDAKAQGTVPSQGAGIVVLKRLADAQKDGDTIYAVIKGSAINNDGALKVGYTAPNAKRQAAVIQSALALAGVSPDSINYVETHGTGTDLGDSIEWEGLSHVFATPGRVANPLALGALKTNIGHTDVAAGVAGLIKAVLALHNRLLPPTLHFQTFSPRFTQVDKLFQMNSQPINFSDSPIPLRAGVSSFGIGGTNVHVVLEEVPVKTKVVSQRIWHLLILSARTPTALTAAASRLAHHMKTHPNISLADIAYTLHVGRKAFPYRRIIVCKTSEQAIQNLSEEFIMPVQVKELQQQPPVVFLFSGQGTQYAEMGKQLYEEELAFRQILNDCLNILKEEFPEVFAPISDFTILISEENLRHPVFVQVALFIIQYSMARLLMSFGIVPKAMLGHSQGEYTAACLSGVLSLRNALKLITMRGLITAKLPYGKMLSVHLSERELKKYLEVFSAIDLAVINHPNHVVVSGHAQDIEALYQQLVKAEVKCQLLPITFASHSRMVESLLPEFTQFIEKNITLSAASIPYISSMSGQWQEGNAVTAHYWAQHLRQPVFFAKGLETLLSHVELQTATLLEVGPNTSLTSLIKQHPAKLNQQTVIPTMRHPYDKQSDVKCLLSALGQLWLSGMSINWPAFYANQGRQRVYLPTYPFERQRYWVDKAEKPMPTYADSNNQISVKEKPVDINVNDIDKQIENLLDQVLKLHKNRSLLINGIKQDYQTKLSSEVLANNKIVAGNTAEQLRHFWQNSLSIEKIGFNDNYFELGGDSLKAINLFSILSEHFKLILRPQLLYQYQTIAELAAYIQTQQAMTQTKDNLAIFSEKSLVLVRLQAGQSGKIPLILVHPVGGEVYVYQDLVQCLGKDQPIYAFRAVSLDGAARPFTSIKAMASQYIDELLNQLGDLSIYQLGGASFGAIVAYEMAQQLQSKGKVLAPLVNIDAPCPSTLSMPSRLESNAKILEYLFGDELAFKASELTSQSLEDQLAFLQLRAKQLRKTHLLPSDLNKYYLETWMANQEAMWQYIPQPYNGDMLFFSHGESTQQYSVRAEASWKSFIKGKFIVYTTPGTHTSMFRHPYVSILANYLIPHLLPAQQNKVSQLSTSLNKSDSGKFSRSTSDISSVNKRYYSTIFNHQYCNNQLPHNKAARNENKISNNNKGELCKIEPIKIEKHKHIQVLSNKKLGILTPQGHHFTLLFKSNFTKTIERNYSFKGFSNVKSQQTKEKIITRIKTNKFSFLLC